MRKIRTKLTLVLSLMAAIVVAVPSVAAADFEWTSEGVPLTETAIVKGQGSFSLGTSNGGLACTNVFYGALLNAHSNTGTFGADLTTQNCKPTGAKQFCEITSLERHYNGAWGIGGSPGGIGTGFGLTVKYKAGAWCLVKEDVYSGGYWISIDNPGEMSTWSWSGQKVGVVEDGISRPATITGETSLNPAKKYGISG